LDPNEISWEICEEKEASFYCKECGQFFCEGCQRGHKKLKLGANHTFVPLEEMDFNNSLPPRPLLCPFHSNQEIDTFCTEEKVPICSKCGVEKHSGHVFQSLSQIIDQTKKDIQTKLHRVFIYSISFFRFLSLLFFPFSFFLKKKKNSSPN